MNGHAMNIVNVHCSHQMEHYNRCLSRHPNEWNTACSSQRHDLARCSETHPVMINVKKKCNSVFQKYEKCNKSYPNDPSRCTEGFEEFLKCVDLVAGASNKY